jgi:hypothetical protein
MLLRGREPPRWHPGVHNRSVTGCKPRGCTGTEGGEGHTSPGVPRWRQRTTPSSRRRHTTLRTAREEENRR